VIISLIMLRSLTIPPSLLRQRPCARCAAWSWARMQPTTTAVAVPVPAPCRRSFSSNSSSSSSSSSTGKSNVTSFFRSLSHRMQGKRHVGTDKAGNNYYVDTTTGRRRWVEYPNEDILGCGETVPMVWHRWLRFGGARAPSLEDEEAEERSKVELASKVARLKEADEKLRMQEIAEREVHADEMDSEVLRNMAQERDQHGGVSSWHLQRKNGTKQQ